MNNSNFSLEQAPNGYYYLKYDMGNSYYKGLINPEFFFEAVMNNYIDVVKEAIEYFGKKSNKDPAIISTFEYEDGENNNFVISFSISNNFVNFNRIIKIPVEKVLKNIQEYIGEQETKILNLKSFVVTQESINISKDTKITLLEAKINELETKIVDLQKTLEYTNNKTDDIVKLVLEQLMKFQNNSNYNSSSSTFNIPNQFKQNTGSNTIQNTFPNTIQNTIQNTIPTTIPNTTTKTNIFLPKPDSSSNPVPQISNLTFSSQPTPKRTFNFNSGTTSFGNFQPIQTNKDSKTEDTNTNTKTDV
jgi:hypothetical protein